MAAKYGVLRSEGTTERALFVIDKQGIIRELENGRPVLVPVLVPAVFVANRAAPGENAPVVGFVSRNFVGRVGWVLEHANLGMVSHYLVVVGYDAHRFAVVEPVRGYRTITFDRLERYRRPYADAALVLSGSRPAPMPASTAASVRSTN